MTKLAIVDMGSVWGGQEIYSKFIAAALIERGWNVSHYSPHLKHQTNEASFKIIPIEYFSFPQLRMQLVPELEMADVIHFNGIRAIYFSSIILKLRPFVGTKHTLYEGASNSHAKVALAKFGSRWAFNNLDSLICVSNSVMEELPDKVKKRSSVVLNGVADIGVNGRPINNFGRLKICFVGRFVDSKGVMRLLRAFFQLRVASVDVELVLAGTGPLESDARNFVLTHNLSDFVTFAGYVENPAEIYNQCHICVLPSMYEGLPLSLLEAMSASCALVAHDIPGVRIVLSHEVNGLFADATDESLADTLQRLAVDRVLLSKLRNKARCDYLDKWQIGRMATETESIYRKVIANAACGVQP